MIRPRASRVIESNWARMWGEVEVSVDRRRNIILGKARHDLSKVNSRWGW